MNNSLGHQRATKRKPGFYTGLKRRVELVNRNYVCVDKEFTQPVCRPFRLGMPVHALEGFMNWLAVACRNGQSLNTHVWWDQTVTNNRLSFQG